MNGQIEREREACREGTTLCALAAVSLSFSGGVMGSVSGLNNLIHVNKAGKPATAGLPAGRLDPIFSDFLGELCLQMTKIYPVESQAWQHTLKRGSTMQMTCLASSKGMQQHTAGPWSCLIMPIRLQKTRSFPTLSATVEVSLPSGTSTRWTSCASTPRSFAISICSAHSALLDAQADAFKTSFPRSRAS